MRMTFTVRDRRLPRLATCLRVLAAVATALLLSGLPAMVAELYADAVTCCGSKCAGSDDQGRCPPDCTYGACAKTVSATLQPLLLSPVPVAPTRTVVFATHVPELSDHRGDVFHPPRA
jgi:hypothetical protein